MHEIERVKVPGTTCYKYNVNLLKTLKSDFYIFQSSVENSRRGYFIPSSYTTLNINNSY